LRVCWPAWKHLRKQPFSFFHYQIIVGLQAHETLTILADLVYIAVRTGEAVLVNEWISHPGRRGF